MATFSRFEDIFAWQRARELSRYIKRLTDKKYFSKDFKLIDQIKGSSGSAMDNIAEGFERGRNKEFIQFLYFSKGSAGETRSQLYRALDNEYISEQEFKEASNLALETGKLVSGLIGHLKSSELKGEKFK
jgi:four helix bundle protein